MSKKNKGPVVIELDETPAASPTDVPPVPEDGLPVTTPVVAAATVAARPRSALVRWAWRIAVALVGFMVSLAAWNWVTGLVATNPVLGLIATLLIGLFVLILLAIALREWLALRRLKRVDQLQHRAVQAMADSDLKAAQSVTRDLEKLYRNRPDAEWGLARMDDLRADVLDADGLLNAAETALLQPLDQAAVAQVEKASRQVATITALVPLALADVVAALTANLRMIREIAEVYGGRGGTLGSWRLARSVMGHLVATGAVSFGDDMLGSVAGGGVLGKLSRRFGEGLVNGALTARVGVAAMEVCRPLPFTAEPRPSVTGILSRALTGLFDRKAA